MTPTAMSAFAPADSPLVCLLWLLGVGLNGRGVIDEAGVGGSDEGLCDDP